MKKMTTPLGFFQIRSDHNGLKFFGGGDLSIAHLTGPKNHPYINHGQS